MNINRFWHLVDSTLAEDQQAQVERLVEALAQLSPREIISFKGHYDTVHAAAHTGMVYAAALVLNRGYCSDDGFEYFRNWLISRGRQAFDAALRDPDTLASQAVALDNGKPSAKFELYGYAAADAYSRRTKRSLDEIDENDDDPWHDQDEADVAEDFDWQEFSNVERLQARLPQLWNRYGAHYSREP